METILVPLDGSAFGEQALPAAIAIARWGDMRLVLAHAHHYVVPSISRSGAPLFEPAVDTAVRGEEKAYLEDVAARVGAVWHGPVSRVILEAPVAEALCHHAQAVRAALIVLSTHGRGGFARAWLGSVADRLIRESCVPTLVVHPGSGAPDLARGLPLDHVLIPLDGSPLAEQAVRPAVRLGRLTEARYTLLRVVEPSLRAFLPDSPAPPVNLEALAEARQEACAYLDAVAAPLRREGLMVSTEARVGSPIAEILSCADTCAVDLIAMATHGREGFARLMVGSVADKVLRGAATPLLVTRPQEARA
jgi:nucleotide-binding universal stress UspA family protein